MTEVGLMDLWSGFNELRKALKVPTLWELPGIWDVKIDHNFRMFMNGHSAPQKYISPMGGTESDLHPYTAHIFFGDWLAAIIDSRDGEFVAHSSCNAEKFLDAAKARVAKEANGGRI